MSGTVAGSLARRWGSPVPGRLAPAAAMAALGLALPAMALAAIGIGAYAISAPQALAILLGHAGIALPVEYTPQQEAVLLTIRVPRVLLAVVAGAALAVAGALLQGLFRNPLADPTLIGVSSGAAFAAAAVIVLGATTLSGLTRLLGPWTLPVAGFAGGLAVTAGIYRISQHEGRTVVASMLLTGIAVNALAFAGIGLFSFLANDEQLRNLMFWNFGSLGGATWTILGVVGPVGVAGTLAAWRLAPALNALLLGEREAGHLGYSVQHLKRGAVALAALLAGFIVAVTGLIGFVSLVAPHLFRLACGPDHRALVPGAALTGALLMLAADMASRTLVAPAELPIGVVTAILGAPFFLFLLARRRSVLE